MPRKNISVEAVRKPENDKRIESLLFVGRNLRQKLNFFVHTWNDNSVRVVVVHDW